MLTYNPFDKEFLANPYPAYRQLREKDPVLRSPLGFWVLSRYEDVRAVQRDRRFALAGPLPTDNLSPQSQRGSLVADVISAYRMFSDPGSHRRFRTIAGRLLAPRQIAMVRPLVQRHARELLDNLTGDRQDGADLIAHYAAPLTLGVVCEWLGVLKGDVPDCRGWAAGLNRVLQPSLRPTDLLGAFQAFRDSRQYFAELIEARRQRPAGDLLSALAASAPEDAGSAASIACVLLGATYETTTNLIGNGLNALTEHHDQLSTLRRSPGLVNRAVSELLRFDSPVQFHGRVALTDVELHEREIPVGGKVILLIGAANRDPEAYREPDRLDVTRSGPPALSFGGGGYHCLGEAFARMTAEVAVSSLLARLDITSMSEGDKPWRTDEPAIRGLREFRVAVRANCS